MAANCLLAACSRNEAQSAYSHVFLKGPTAMIHAPLSLVCHRLIHTHNYNVRTETTKGQWNIHKPLRASSWEQDHYFCNCFRTKKIFKNQPSSHRRGTRWQVSGGLGSWRAEPELCAALSDLQSQFDWFKAPVHPPSSFSSPSNSPHGGFLSGLTERPFRRCTRVVRMWHLNCFLQ